MVATSSQPVTANALDRLRANLAQLLAAHGTRHLDLADHVGKSEAWLSLVLSGKRGIKLDVLDAIAGFFDVELARLFDNPSPARPGQTARGGAHAHAQTAHTRRLKPPPPPQRRPAYYEAFIARQDKYIDRLLDVLDALRSGERAHLARIVAADRLRRPRPLADRATRGTRPDAARGVRPLRAVNR